MTKQPYQPYPYKSPAGWPNLDLGPRLQHDITRRIRELEARLPLSLTKSDLYELNRLRSLLQLMRTP